MARSVAVSRPVIVIDSVVKDYQALRPLRLKQLVVAERERVALSGLDAAGAEVFVNIVNGAILPDQGTVTLFGQPTHSIENEKQWFAILDRLGIVTVRAVLLEAATVRQNLALPFTIDIDDLPPEIQATTTAIGAEIELPKEQLDQPLSSVPPPYRMRIHLGRALATQPELLLLEHPTASLPREEVSAFAGLIKKTGEARRLTMLIITEDVELAAEVATSHYRLRAGTGELVNARGWRRYLGSG